VRACVEGPSGLKAHDSTIRMVTGPGGTVVRWPNGARAHLLGANSPEDVERLRAAGNSCLGWLEELAAWRYLDATFDQMRFGLRSGTRPHWIASTTPKPKPLIKKLVAGEIADVVPTYATTYDNPHLSGHIKQALEDSYGSTQLGSQELYGRLLEEDRDALWSRGIIDSSRVADYPDLSRITVGVDPSGGAGEQGIVVVGKSRPVPTDGGRLVSHGYVLDDRTVHLSPDGWGRAAVQAALDWDADDLVVERNYGGDMAVSVIKSALEKVNVSLPVRVVTATRGKAVRAQPVSALTSQGRWHFAGRFPELEDQLCTWTPDAPFSPDRLDAMVWCAWHLKLVGTSTGSQGRMGGAAALRKIA
jgi:phage terminase large subunit-like protein